MKILFLQPKHILALQRRCESLLNITQTQTKFSTTSLLGNKTSDRNRNELHMKIFSGEWRVCIPHTGHSRVFPNKWYTPCMLQPKVTPFAIENKPSIRRSVKSSRWKSAPFQPKLHGFVLAFRLCTSFGNKTMFPSFVYGTTQKQIAVRFTFRGRIQVYECRLRTR